MKGTLVWLIMTGLLLNCGKQAIDTPACDVNTDYTKDATQAADWIVGEWKLVELTSMIPNPPVEDLRLRFTKDGEVTTSRDNQPTATNRYAIKSTPDGLLLQTNAEPGADNWHVRNPTVRICANELFLDGGIAFDGPGYLFRRIQ